MANQKVRCSFEQSLCLEILLLPAKYKESRILTVNHIFQYPNGEAVHPVIKNFEDFQKIQNYVGSGLTAKEIVAKISKLQETGGYSSLTSKIKGECKSNCMPFPQLLII